MKSHRYFSLESGLALRLLASSGTAYERIILLVIPTGGRSPAHRFGTIEKQLEVASLRLTTPRPASKLLTVEWALASACCGAQLQSPIMRAGHQADQVYCVGCMMRYPLFSGADEQERGTLEEHFRAYALARGEDLLSSHITALSWMGVTRDAIAASGWQAAI